jgi:conjugal transfer pilus assembly protein TrbC
MRGVIFSIFACLMSFQSLHACCLEDGLNFSVEKEPEFFAFVSLSIPETTLKQMSKELERIEGAFVFRGMPNDSFSDFIKKVMHFREQGILAPILVDPDAFTQYNVTEVPTFVYLPPSRETLSAKELSRASEDTSYPKYKKIVGNVSISYALEKMGEM